MALVVIKMKLEDVVKGNRLFKEEKSLPNDVVEKGKTKEKFDSVVEEALKMKQEVARKDKEGHPVFYNIFGVLDSDKMHNKTLSTEEKWNRFLRWRVQVMEKRIQKLDFSPTWVSCFLELSDLKNTLGPSEKEVGLSAKQRVIYVPFWYYAFTTLLSPFLSTRTKSKFVYARPSRVTETLLK
ncbi:hypothetical protein SLEP1_g56471 [Rubroshorea leprosula]|uniref:Uncharacterized protein n=1 Tax=Rubroshorea leprosula TaxID=152421 RepID=A0AAV5MIK8_9ROSI|nr:hypothetical protein SLEP1_g56471 [Rubroshorea leprosula]